LSDSHGITQLKPASSQIVALSAMLRGRVNLQHSLPYVSRKWQQPAEQAQLIFRLLGPVKSNKVFRTDPICPISDIRGRKGNTIDYALFCTIHPFVETAQEEYDQATLKFPGLRVRKQAAFPTRVFPATLLFFCLYAPLNFPASLIPGRDFRSHKIRNRPDFRL
jgi:hypothetical protein